MSTIRASAVSDRARPPLATEMAHAVVLSCSSQWSGSLGGREDAAQLGSAAMALLKRCAPLQRGTCCLPQAQCHYSVVLVLLLPPGRLIRGCCRAQGGGSATFRLRLESMAVLSLIWRSGELRMVGSSILASSPSFAMRHSLSTAKATAVSGRARPLAVEQLIGD